MEEECGVPRFGAALLEEAFVGSFFVVGEGRQHFGRHWAGGVRAGVVKGADGLVHPALEGGRGGEGPVCGGPGLEERVWDHVTSFREEAVTELGQLDVLGVVKAGGASFREKAFVCPVHLHRAVQGPVQVALEVVNMRRVVKITEV
jgi:hypothetical protein